MHQILDAAEQLFIEEGFTVTTTNAIAARANVPIGSLYQFFPDKAAIVQALARRYVALLHQRFEALQTDEALQLPLSDYVDQMIDLTNQFFKEHPGYHAIFMQVQGRIPELETIEAAADAQFIQELSAFLLRRDASQQTHPEAIAFVVVKAVGTLLWLALSQEPAFRQQLVAETKRLMLTYLQSYLPDAPCQMPLPDDPLED